MNDDQDPHSGSSFESFLDETGLRGDADAVALKRVIAWRIQEQMQSSGVTKKELATRLHTSRSQLDRLLDPENAAVQLDTLVKGAKAAGLMIHLELVPLRG